MKALDFCRYKSNLLLILVFLVAASILFNQSSNSSANYKSIFNLKSVYLEPENRVRTIKNFFSWYKFSDIYLDKHKSASFYTLTGDLLLSVLYPARKIDTIEKHVIEIQLNLKYGPNSVYSKSFRAKINSRRVMSNKYYIYSYARVKLAGFSDLISRKYKNELNYTLRIDNQVSDELNANIVYHKSVTGISKLTKCLYLTNKRNSKSEFKNILELTSSFNYSTFYICNFNDRSIHKILTKSRLNVTEILLDRVPNFLSKRFEYFYDFKEIAQSSSDPNTLFDPISEYLYNIMYPQLIDLYAYVYASDYDQLMVPIHGQNALEYLTNIKAKERINDEVSSIYIRQFWYLENTLGLEIIHKIKSELQRNRKSVTFPVLIESKCRIIIKDSNDLEYASKIVKVYEKLNASISSKCRFLYVTFKEAYIYGQTVHSTRASEIVKLVGAGSFFPGRLTHTLDSIHLAHYRDEYNFEQLGARLSIRRFNFDENIVKYCR
jgi:hypothetical protein